MRCLRGAPLREEGKLWTSVTECQNSTRSPLVSFNSSLKAYKRIGEVSCSLRVHFPTCKMGMRTGVSASQAAARLEWMKMWHAFGSGPDT